MTNVVRKINAQQQKALDWLITNGGSGQFDADGQHIIANEHTHKYSREIWVGLRDANRIEFYNDGNDATTPFGGVRVIKDEPK